MQYNHTGRRSAALHIEIVYGATVSTYMHEQLCRSARSCASPPLSFETASLRTTTTSTLRPRENLSSSPSIDSTTNSTSSAALHLQPPTVNRLVLVTRYTLFLHSMPPCVPRPLKSFPYSATLSSYNRNLSPATAIAIKYNQPPADTIACCDTGSTPRAVPYHSSNRPFECFASIHLTSSHPSWLYYFSLLSGTTDTFFLPVDPVSLTLSILHRQHGDQSFW